ncbi:GRN protein, partial [Rhinopomastus cyanomelas]|nr:GRN protein [Rhinopomastus cyanomelas]
CLGGLSCPLGSHCSADGQSCLTLPGMGGHAWRGRRMWDTLGGSFTPYPLSAASRAVPCPDGQSECPDNATCCVTASGAWGCCPMPQASCCADKVHCCPHATRCDLAHGRCLSPTGISVPLGTTFPAWKRQPSLPATPRQVLCPSNHSACPDGSTCCQMASAQYGCCPLQNAICCSDGHHCCPQGTICDLKHSSCSAAWPPLTLVQAQTVPLSPAQDILCKDGLRCPDGNTCCPSGLGVWGCCPLEEAVCCSDLLHCCPRGTTCDPEGGSCLQEDGGRVPWVQKTPGLRRARDVRCDEVTSCPDGNTCCRLSSGAWGCCP